MKSRGYWATLAAQTAIPWTSWSIEPGTRPLVVSGAGSGAATPVVHRSTAAGRVVAAGARSVRDTWVASTIAAAAARTPAVRGGRSAWRAVKVRMSVVIAAAPRSGDEGWMGGPKPGRPSGTDQ